MLMDENAQISAEMILLMGAILVLVIVAGGFILNISQQIANSIGTVLDTARNSTINRM
ncbi:class III signal peptide-containing protein [Methanobacterium sp.]|uniref:class III signal peptide-containing protein n=1 Tax=Methanobacterium sp. TaxID=2164 RepID=UPI003C7104D1